MGWPCPLRLVMFLPSQSWLPTVSVCCEVTSSKDTSRTLLDSAAGPDSLVRRLGTQGCHDGVAWSAAWVWDADLGSLKT